MMKTGTRVIVLTSTLKRGIGPRQGSIGYITNKKVSAIRFHGPLKTFVSLTSVVFTRYGFESKRRKEHKFFINMFPILTDGNLDCLVDFTKPAAIKKYFNSRINELSKVDILNKGNFWHQVRKELVRIYHLDPRNIKAGVLVPAFRPDLLICNDMEFAAWLDAMLADSDIYSALSHLTRAKNKRISDMIDSSTLSLLYTTIVDKKYRKIMLAEYANTLENRKHVIRNLRIVHSVAHRHSERIKRDEAVSYLLRMGDKTNKPSKGQLITSLRLLYTPSYCESEFLWKAKLLFANKKDKSPIDIFLNSMTELRCLGQDLEKKKVVPAKNAEGKKEAACKAT